jgi:hypothetical protein
VTGIPEVVRDGETGLQVPQRDPAALAAAIERLLDDAHLRVRLASQARRLIETEFDIRQNTVRLREIFLAAGEETADDRARTAETAPPAAVGAGVGRHTRPSAVPTPARVAP